LDDLIVTKVNDKLLYVVSNAAMKAQDMDIIKSAVAKSKSNGKDVTHEFLPSSEQSLIAVQGPKAANILSKLLLGNANLNQLHFMETMTTEIAGVPDCRITRCGYTGEDGVEITVPSDKVQHITEGLLSANLDMKLAGLGARDSLRLEAGLCLYGSDINVNTTPIEAGLAWIVAKRRRSELNFPGAQRICEQLKRGVARHRIGLKMSQPNMPPARTGVEIYHKDNCVGEITSGCPSPNLGINIAMGYVNEGLNKPGQSVQLKIRNNLYEALVVKMPFVKTNYFIKK